MKCVQSINLPLTSRPISYKSQTDKQFLVCASSLSQVTVMQTVWFSTNCSSRPSLASSASSLWTGTPAGGSDSGWRPTGVLTVRLVFFIVIKPHWTLWRPTGVLTVRLIFFYRPYWILQRPNNKIYPMFLKGDQGE